MYEGKILRGKTLHGGNLTNLQNITQNMEKCVEEKHKIKIL